MAFIQAVLDGREPLFAVHQIEQHLGLGSHVLQKSFPKNVRCLLRSIARIAMNGQDSELRRHVLRFDKQHSPSMSKE